LARGCLAQRRFAAGERSDRSPLRDGERVPAAVQFAVGVEQRSGECVFECRFVRSAAGRRAREQVRGEHHRALRVPSGDVEQQAEYPLAVAVLLLKADRDVLRERLHTARGNSFRSRVLASVRR
jgi:hypothetical protein